ncbi:MAG: cell division protein FtsA [Alphaproteobacteria bacterium TMED194]|nr:MAG: cell division protein FtsA [Alphaproteobacteria bacterium TMED194]
MNKRKNLLAVMDIGSSKINCLQCFTDNNDITKVIGLSTIASKGVASGIITDFSLAYDSISKAIRECEKQSNENIGELAISISSHKCFTKTIRAKAQVKDEIIKSQDIKLTMDKVLEDSYFFDKKIINISPTDYIIDDASGIINPINMYGNKLEIDFLATYVGINQYKNYAQTITKCNVDIHRIVFSNNAAGFAVLNENELELGSIVVDIGARTTSIGMFIKNNFIYSNVLSFGGSDITEAIARKLSITYEEAEKLKVLYASVIDASQEEDIPYEVPSINFENENNYIQVSRRKLYELVQPFYEQILKWIHSSIENSGYKNLIGKVLVFTGGASQIDGLTTMVSNNYNYNSRIGTPKNIKFNNNEILDASHSVAAGLIQNEININNKNRSKYTIRDDKRNLEKKKNFSFLKQWVGDNFF